MSQRMHVLSIALFCGAACSGDGPTTRPPSIVDAVQDWYLRSKPLPSKSEAASLFLAAETSADGRTLFAAALLGGSEAFKKPDADAWLIKAANLGNVDARSKVTYRVAMSRAADERLKWSQAAFSKLEGDQAKRGGTSAFPILYLGAVFSSVPLSADDVKGLKNLGELAYHRGAVSGLALVGAGLFQEGNFDDAISMLHGGDVEGDPSSQMALIEAAMPTPDRPNINLPTPEEFTKTLQAIVDQGRANSKTYRLLERCYSEGIGVEPDPTRAAQMRDLAEIADHDNEHVYTVEECSWLKEFGD